MIWNIKPRAYVCLWIGRARARGCVCVVFDAHHTSDLQFVRPEMQESEFGQLITKNQDLVVNSRTA